MACGKVAEIEGKRADAVPVVGLLRNDRPRHRMDSVCDGELLLDRDELDQTCVLENLWRSLVIKQMEGREISHGVYCSGLDEGW